MGVKELKVSTKVSPAQAAKTMADEEVARRLHEELNGPELSPAAAAGRRSRKATSFYTPSMGGSGGLALHSEEEKGEAGARSPKSPFKLEAERHEKAGSSTGKRHGGKGGGPLYDSAENSPPPSARSRGVNRQKQEAGSHATDAPAGKAAAQEGVRETRMRTKDSASEMATGDARAGSSDRARVEQGGRVTRSSAAEPAVDKSEKWPSLKATWGGSGDAKSEDVATPRAAASGRLPAGSGTGRASSAATSSRTSGQQDAAPAKPKQYPRVPKLPMCLYGDTWYRARKIGETAAKVNLEFPGVASASDVWLPKDSTRIWTGSYKGKDWKHLGDGGWEPKCKEEPQGRRGRGKKRRSAPGTEASGSLDSDEETDADVNASIAGVPSGRSNGHAAGESLPSSSNGPSDGDPTAAAEVKVERTEDSKAGRGAEQKLPRGRGGRRGRPPSSKRMKVQEDADVPAEASEHNSERVGSIEKEGGETSPLRADKADSPSEQLPDGAVGMDIDPAEEMAEAPLEERKSPTPAPEAPPAASLTRKRGRGGRRGAPPSEVASLNERVARKRSKDTPATDTPNEEEEQTSARAETETQNPGERKVQQGRDEQGDVTMAEAVSPPDEEEDSEEAHKVAASLLEMIAGPPPPSAAQEPREDDDSPKPTKLGYGGDEASPDAQDGKAAGAGLGVLAIAMADAGRRGQAAACAELAGPPKSARNRKRALAKVARAILEAGPTSPSGKSVAETERAKSASEASPSISPKSKANSHDKPSSADASPEPSETWKKCWNKKHIHRLEEVEAEEEAAGDEEIPENAQEPFPQQPIQRPMRAIRGRTARYANTSMDRSEAVPPRDAEGGSPPTPVRRAGRGRGRWANHVKKGTGGRGPRPMQNGSSQDTGRPGRGGGRGRRGGGRWGNRQPKVQEMDTCIHAFGNLVNALDSKVNGGGHPGTPYHESAPLCHRILELSPDSFARLGVEPCHDVKTFRMPPPPVPLFRVAV